MKKNAKVFIAGLIGLILVVVSVLIYFAPFLIASNSFVVTIGGGESIIQNSDFGIEFRVKSECYLKNRYHRYSGGTLWDGLLICEGGELNNALHLVVSNDVDSMIGGSLYRDMSHVYYDELQPELGILRVRSNDGKQALLIATYDVIKSNKSQWNDVLESIRSYNVR